MATLQTPSDKSGFRKSQDGNYYPGSENVREDLKSLKEGGTTLTQHLREDTQGIAKSVKAEVQRELEDLKSLAGNRLESLERRITDKPVQSVAIAFVSGIVLSLLLGRK